MAVEQMNALIVTQLAEKLNMTDSRRMMGTWIKGMADPSELYLDETEITAGAHERLAPRAYAALSAFVLQ